MTEPTVPEAPVEVRESVKNDVAVQTVRVFLLGAFAFAAGLFVKSEVVLAALVPVGACIAGFAATYIVGLQKLLSTHAKLKLLVPWAPDDVARFK